MRLAVVYNPFDLSQTTKHELEFGVSKTLADYMVGLPSEVEWNVAYNGELVAPEDWASVKPEAFSNITVVRVPEGGGGNSGKSVLRIVAMIAVMTFAQWAGPALIASFTGSTAAAVSAAAATSAVGIAAGAATAAIGVAGSLAVNAILAPKAPSQEKTSTAYGLDGAKNTAREGVVVPVTYGDFRLGGNLVDVFTRNVGEDQYLYVRAILNDGEVEDITDIELNGQPLSSFTDVQTRIDLGQTPSTPNDWFGEVVRQFNRSSVITAAWQQHVTDGQVDRLRADVVFPGGLYFAKDDGRKISASVTLEFEYQTLDANGQPSAAWTPVPLSAGSPPLGVSDSSSRTKRLTYESATLPRSRYAMRIRRTQSDDPQDKRTDECFLSDFGEIENEPTNVNGTANLSLRVKMTDQLSGLPTLTALVKGSLVNIYDEDGNVLAREKSANPADIVVDMLLNTTRGAGYAPRKIVWPRYVEFREHCIDNGYEFHGAFDSVESLWDTAQTVAARGHGTLIPQGTKYGFAIDRAATPEMIFTPANMFVDSFRTSWLATGERANEIQLSFTDRDNGYKQRTIRVTDNVAFARGDRPKVASVSGFGIDNVQEAIREAEFAARTNRYIKKTVEFDAPLEAIGIKIGDVALVQHDSIDFNGSVGGRLKTGSTTTMVNLDRPVTMEAGKSYRLMVIESAIKRHDVTVVSVSGSAATVSGLPDAHDRLRRFVQGGTDVEIVSARKVGNDWRLTLSDTTEVETGVAELWDTDVVEERAVVVVAGDHETVELQQALVQAPSEYANFLFGELNSLKRPFRLKSVSGSEPDRRTLTMMQYDDRVYQRGGFETIDVTPVAPTPVPQVLGLIANHERNPQPEQTRIPVTLSWTRPNDINYAGADVYYDLLSDSVGWKSLGQVFDATSLERDFQRGDNVRFKVVAFDNRGQRAPFASAPTYAVNLTVFDRNLGIPRLPTYSVPFFASRATVRLNWLPPENDSPPSYRVEAVSISPEERVDLEDAILNPVYFPPSQPDDTPEYKVVPPPAVENKTDWVSLTTAATTLDIPNIQAGSVAFRIRAENTLTTSEWVWLAATVDAVALPAPANLRLNGVVGQTQFTGMDASFSWDDIIDVANAPVPEGEEAPNPNLASVWQDYKVEILDGETVVRTEYTRTPAWTYTFDKNAADTPSSPEVTARRAFTFRLSLRGLQGQLSTPVSLTVSNPRPPMFPVSVEPGASSVTLVFQTDQATDFGGIVVKASATENDPAAPIVFDGPSAATWSLPASGPSYYRYAFYDRFDRLNLTFSAEASVIGFAPDLSEIDGRLDEIEEALGGIPELVTNANNQLEETIAGPNGYLTTRLNSIDRQISITNPEAGSLGSRFLSYEGRDENGITRLGGLELAVGSPDGNGSLFGRLFTVEGIFRNPDGSISADRIENIEAEINTPVSGLKARIASLDEITSDGTFVRASQLTTINTAISQRARTFAQPTMPTGSPNNILLAAGDLWIDTDDNNKLYRHDGSGWVAVSSTPPSSVTVFAQPSQPVGRIAGDLWFDTDAGNRQYRFDGSDWVLVASTTRTYAQPTAPTGATLAIGDLWVDTDANNRIHRWDGSNWIDIQAGSVRTFAQPTAPGQPLFIGDMWFDTDDGNKLYRWTGSVWTPVDDARVGIMFGTYAQSLQDISDLKLGKASVGYATEIETKANLKNRTFAQPTAPVSPVDNISLVFGDLWMDTDDNNQIYRWNGSAWALVHDQRGEAALQELINARGGYPSISARFGTFTGTVASALEGKASAVDFGILQTEVTNARGGAGSLSQRLTTIDSSLAGKATASQLTTLSTRVDQKARTFMQPTMPTGSPDGLLLAAGDLWIDTDDGYKYYRYDGSNWIIFSAPTTKTYAQPNQPVGQADGDLWFDTDDRNRQYRFNGTSWVLVQSATTVSYAQTTAPTGPDIKEGDLWCDTDDNNRLYRYNGSSWVSVQSLTTRTFAQPTAPGQPLFLGDMWFDTDDSNKLHRWAGTSWVPVDDARVGVLRTDFETFKSGVTDILNGTASATAFDLVNASIRLRNRSFAQASAPVSPVNDQALAIGDLWMDTDDNNKIYRWNGSAWGIVHDQRGEAALNELATARGGFANLSARFGTLTTTVSNALAGKADASRVETLETTIEGPPGQPQNGLRASVTFARDTAVAASGTANAVIGLTSNANGVITGFTSVNPGPGRNMTEFKIQADKFQIVPSSSSGARTEFVNGCWKVYNAAGALVVELGLL